MVVANTTGYGANVEGLQLCHPLARHCEARKLAKYGKLLFVERDRLSFAAQRFAVIEILGV
jgi:hypothetical protein